MPQPIRTRRHSTLPISFIRSITSSAFPAQHARPPTAPRQFPDLKAIREEPDLFAHNARLRNYAQHSDSSYKIRQLYQRIHEINVESKAPRSQLKALEKKLGAARAAKNDAEASQIYAAIQSVREQVDSSIDEHGTLTDLAHNLALVLPNLTSPQTPQDGSPKVLGYLNYDPVNPPELKSTLDHATIGTDLGILDFSSASTTTGWGFYYLLDHGVLLEQALIQYATAIASKHGWKMVTPPSLVYSHIADACGFQPRDANDEQQIWQLAQSEKDAAKPKRSLAATAEIPLAGLYADKSIPEEKLPLRLVGTSRCYRAEAGARGVDTKGLYRVHEFSKVEMFAWANPHPGHSWSQEAVSNSSDIFDEMVAIQKQILTGLGLPCRILEMPSTDLGASAFRKIDIEAFFPSRTNRDGGWGELTSVSICTDYQSRRLNTRIKDRDGGRTRFPHTINGTAMAVPRVLACILEHGWRPEERCVIVPEVLRPFMGVAKIQTADQ